jgi:hypothetical protein
MRYRNVEQAVVKYLSKGDRTIFPYSMRISWPDGTDQPYLRVFVQMEMDSPWEAVDVPIAIGEFPKE